MKRNALIKRALLQRHREVCGKIQELPIGVSLDVEPFLSQVRQITSDRAAGDLQCIAPLKWYKSTEGCDCFVSLRKVVLREELPMIECSAPAGSDFVRKLRASANNSSERVRLLMSRYVNPINFSAPSEIDVREYVLGRLMVQDRARIERESFESVADTDVILRLALVAIHCCTNADWRFLDALNYYFELLPSSTHSSTQNSWLFASFLALYARALRHRSGEIDACV